MLNGMRVYSSDSVWRQILNELGATVVDVPNVLDINIDKLKLNLPISPTVLKSKILFALDYQNELNTIFGKDIPNLSHLQRQIIVALYLSGGMSGEELRKVLGFAPGVTSHTCDTAISQLRKNIGHNFIINKDGKYLIGEF